MPVLTGRSPFRRSLVYSVQRHSHPPFVAWHTGCALLFYLLIAS